MDDLAVSRILTDPYALKILKATYGQALSPYDMCNMFDIPIMQCFSMVHKLQGLGFLKVVKQSPQQNGNLRTYYRSRARSINITIKNGELKVNVEWDFDPDQTEKSLDVILEGLEI